MPPIRIDELISQLQRLREEHGDLYVELYVKGKNYYSFAAHMRPVCRNFAKHEWENIIQIEAAR